MWQFIPITNTAELAHWKLKRAYKALIDIINGRSKKFRLPKRASTFTAEALAIGETLENNVKKNRSKTS
jgi:hypothetical protein